MGQNVELTSVQTSKEKKKEPLIPRCLTRKQINYIKMGVIGIIILLGTLHILPRTFALAPKWVKYLFSIYIFVFMLPEHK